MRKLQLLRFAVLLVVLPIAAHAQYSVLYNFGSKIGDPCQPNNSGIIAQGRDGNLYSTAPFCGGGSLGAVFKITLPTGALKVLYNFDSTHGNAPTGGLTLGTDGYFYGTTSTGGIPFNVGTVFKITPAGSLTVLYKFTNSTDGAYPLAPPIQGTDGNLYGTTSGAACQGSGASYGSIYKFNTLSGTFTPLYQFDSTHGWCPSAPLVQATDGNFYGTAYYGGTINNNGVVFRITPTGKLTVLHNFDFTHGSGPAGPLIQASDGNLYGTTTFGGTGSSGVVFKMTLTGSFTVLHNMNGTTDGEVLWAGLVQATDGNFYGASRLGGDLTCPNGDLGCGTLFKITPPPKSTFSVFYNFEVPTGFEPLVTPLQRTDGILYGDTSTGGTGAVYQGCSAVDVCGVFYKYNAKLLPFVSLLPYSGKIGDTIEFLGQGFTSSTTVSFNGTAASRTVVSGTYLTATVPNGATTGFVTVTTSGGTLKSNKIFRVIPQIMSFSPTSGPVGTVVTINGKSFTKATSVTFGGVKATSFTVNSYTKITATVPTGAKTGTISVTTLGGTATSAGIFTVTE